MAKRPGLTAALDRLAKIEGLLARIATADPTPLLEEFERIVEADNERGVLAGLDKDGNPMPPVTYRPKASKGPGLSRKQQSPRHNAFGKRYQATGDNLTSSQYRKLDGPPLAPRRKASRVIKNLDIGSFYDPATGKGIAFGAWKGVVSKKGVAFLAFHFNGEGRLPRRDLRGVRPWGREQAKQALRRWWKSLLKG